MRAFVTGGSGHVGGNLVRELLSRGYEVDCLVRSDTRALDNLDVNYVNGDMLNPLEMSTLMADSDVVFHSAAFVAVEKIHEDLMRKISIPFLAIIIYNSFMATLRPFPPRHPISKQRSIIKKLIGILRF